MCCCFAGAKAKGASTETKKQLAGTDASTQPRPMPQPRKRSNRPAGRAFDLQSGRLQALLKSGVWGNARSPGSAAGTAELATVQEDSCTAVEADRPAPKPRSRGSNRGATCRSFNLDAGQLSLIASKLAAQAAAREAAAVQAAVAAEAAARALLHPTPKPRTGRRSSLASFGMLTPIEGVPETRMHWGVTPAALRFAAQQQLQATPVEGVPERFTPFRPQNAAAYNSGISVHLEASPSAPTGSFGLQLGSASGSRDSDSPSVGLPRMRLQLAALEEAVRGIRQHWPTPSPSLSSSVLRRAAPSSSALSAPPGSSSQGNRQQQSAGMVAAAAHVPQQSLSQQQPSSTAPSVAQPPLSPASHMASKEGPSLSAPNADAAASGSAAAAAQLDIMPAYDSDGDCDVGGGYDDDYPADDEPAVQEAPQDPVFSGFQPLAAPQPPAPAFASAGARNAVSMLCVCILWFGDFVCAVHIAPVFPAAPSLVPSPHKH